MTDSNTQGYVLFTALIFMVLLAILGATTLQGSNVEFRMSANTAYKKQAFQQAESGRTALGDVLEEHVDLAGTWPSYLVGGADPNGRQPDLLIDNVGHGTADNLSINDDNELPDNPNRDAYVLFDFDQSGAAEGSTLRGTANTDRVDISVYNLKTSLAQGNSVIQQAGYQGLGKGAAGGGAHVFYQINAGATASAGAAAMVVADFRVVP